MNIDFATKQDFELLDNKVSKILEALTQTKTEGSNNWMKSADVKRLLNCSDSTLTNYRKKGLLPFTQISGTYYYSRKEVAAMMHAG